MFGRKGDEMEPTETITAPPASRAPEATPVARTASPALARRIVEMPGSRRSSSPAGADDRVLKVGKGLTVNGEITSCDILVVEGKVEAKLSDGKMLEIAESGQFRGSVEIENADIAGRFDGQLVVHGRLTVRATGRVSGMVKYGEIEINAGGQIIGEMQVSGGGSAQSSTTVTVGSSSGPSSSGFKSAKFAALTDEDDSDTKSASLKSA